MSADLLAGALMLIALSLLAAQHSYWRKRVESMRDQLDAANDAIRWKTEQVRRYERTIEALVLKGQRDRDRSAHTLSRVIDINAKRAGR